MNLLLPLLLAASALAQEPSPAPSPPLPSVLVSAAASPAASPTPSLLKKAGVKIQFLPPPMEGAISLGIYDSTGKLVRTLHRAATGDEFVAALDGYITHWDGLDDAGHLLPAGHYSAKGYMVGDVTVRKLGVAPPGVSGSNAASATPQTPLYSSTDVDLTGKPFVPPKIRIGLVANPLDQDRAGSAELAAGFDSNGSWLQLADGLPLKQISATPNLKWAALTRTAPGAPSLVFFQSNGPAIEAFLITNISDMMAFDCGGFDFNGAAATPAPQ